MKSTTNTAVIFDIDGTLVESSGFEDDLYIAAVRDVLGDVCIRKAWNTYRHVTDTGILRQIMEEHRIRGQDRRRGEHRIRGEGLVREVRARFGDLVRKYLRDGGECNPIDGAIDLIDELRAAPGFAVGFATGGWGHTARMKLEHAGFNLEHAVLASSDDSEERTGIMQKCLDTLDAKGNSFQRIVYVGDAEWDVRATRELGWHFIGVGPRLKGRCTCWVEDFSNQNVFMEMLHAR
ncbi:MAG: HAD family hydrolase [Gemmatimonadetes bacterium]|nr:HAD family hydrolase [Gemmatimonadota bacterium]MYG16129.1 HAD family hydrolase [Gemmatimonadota bacterium]